MARKGGPVYSPRYSGGDVDDPAFLDLLRRLDEWDDAPSEVRDLVAQFRPLVEQDRDAWRRRHDESTEIDEARENLDGLKRNLAEQGLAVDDFDSEVVVTEALLAQRVARLQPWERATFDRLLAEETGDAWTPLPKVTS